MASKKIDAYLECEAPIYKWLKSGCLTKHPFKAGCLGFQVKICPTQNLGSKVVENSSQGDPNPDSYKSAKHIQRYRPNSLDLQKSGGWKKNPQMVVKNGDLPWYNPQKDAKNTNPR